jgi:hypothetical protein
MFLAIYNGVQVPVDIAFDFKWLDHPLMVTLNIMIDFLFVLDIVLNFLTTYLDPISGEEVVHPKKIAKRYIFSF